VTDSSLSADLVIRTTGVGTHIGAGAILTLTRTTAIILTILRMGTIMVITIAPSQEGDSLAPDPSDSRAILRLSRVFPSKFAVGRSPSETRKKVAL
jgi:hypothetical protein